MYLQRSWLAAHNLDELCGQVLCEERVGAPKDELVADGRQLRRCLLCSLRVTVRCVWLHPGQDRSLKLLSKLAGLPEHA